MLAHMHMGSYALLMISGCHAEFNPPTMPTNGMHVAVVGTCSLALHACRWKNVKRLVFALALRAILQSLKDAGLMCVHGPCHFSMSVIMGQCLHLIVCIAFGAEACLLIDSCAAR